MPRAYGDAPGGTGPSVTLWPTHTRAERAAQFMPFAALTGYYDLVRAAEHVTEPRRPLTAETQRRVSEALAGLRRGMVARVTHYARDAYVTTEGVVGNVDAAGHTIEVACLRIRFEDIADVVVAGTEGP